MIKYFSIILLLAHFAASAATYYIDYAGGSDSNAGTTTNTAWKHVPAMASFSGTYAHAAGDRFIFKGGVVWSNACLPLKILTSGTAASRDYYGVDSGWYAGGSWSRPVFDAGGVTMTNFPNDNMIWIKDAGNIQIDKIEMRNWVWTDPVPTSNVDGFSVYCDSASNILISAIYAHDWVILTNRDDKFGGVGQYGSWGLTLSNSIIAGPTNIAAEWVSGAYNASGAGSYNFETLVGNDISRVSQGIFNGVMIRSNTVHTGGQSFRAEEHENAINVMDAVSTVSGNIVRDWLEGTAIYLYGAWSDTVGATQHVQNNILWNNGVAAFSVESDRNTAEKHAHITIDNNTVMGGLMVQASDRTGQGIPALDIVEIRNNLWITNGTSESEYWMPMPIPTLVIANNLTWTTAQAAAANLTTDNVFEPQSLLAGITGAGLDLSASFTTDYTGATRSAPWDIGAYEYSGGEIPPDDPPAASGRATVSGTVRVGTLRR